MTTDQLDRLLGCILLNPSSIFDILNIIPIKHFPEPYKSVLQYIEAQAGKVSLDQIVVAMPTKSDLLVSCADNAVTGESAVSVAKIVAPDLRRKYIMDVLTSGVNKLSLDVDAELVVRQIFQELDSGRNDTVLDMPECFQKALEIIDKKRKGTLKGWGSGLLNLDDMIGRLWGGDLWVVAGRPGMGKTAFALCVAIHNAYLGEPVAFFSLEMTPEQLMSRAISITSGIPFYNIHTGRLTDLEYTKVKSTENFFKGLPLYILPASTPSMYEIQRESIRLSKQHGVKMVIVDYLQRVAFPAHHKGNVDAAVGANCKVAKSIAKEIDGVVMLLSQLNRLSEGKDDKRPGLHHLRDSGNIEQEADCVVFLYRKDYYTKANTGHVEFLVEKNRHGKTGSVLGYFDAEHLYFSIDSQKGDRP